MHDPGAGVGAYPASHLEDGLISHRQRAAKNQFVMGDAVAQVAQRQDRLMHEIVLGTDHLSLSTRPNLTMGAHGTRQHSHEFRTRAP